MQNQPGKRPSKQATTRVAERLSARFGHAAPRLRDIVALLAGTALPLAFSPFDLFPLGIVLPALLFVLWLKCPPGSAAWRGFLFGVGTFGVGTSWVYVSLHNYGNMPIPLAVLTVLLFTVALAAFPAIVGWLQARLKKPQGALHVVMLVPALWVLLEWTRGWFLTGFPWLNLGYSQIGWPLGGFASWLGVYGVSLATALSAALIVQGLRDRVRRWRVYVPGLIVLWTVGWLAGTVEWTHPVGAPLRVALVQANVPLTIKWRPDHRRRILERYLNLSATAKDIDLVVWPEAAMPAYLDELDPHYIGRLRRLAGEYGHDYLIGVVERDQTEGAYYNSVISIGTSPGIYRKQHLVPLGEFLPLKSIMSWLLAYLQIPMSDFSAGAPNQKPMKAAGHVIGVSICYEDAFGQEIIRSLPQATLLVNVSEDAWFGNSLAPHQRLQMARMRAVETGRPMLRAANTGLSAVINPRGQVTTRSPQFQAFVLSEEVQPMQGATPYARFGNWLVVLISVLLISVYTVSAQIFPIKESNGSAIK